MTKFPKVQESIFSVMTQLATQHGAMNLAQGYPDFSPPPMLIQELHKAARGGQNQYAPMAGIVPLREKIALKMERMYSAQYDPGHEITLVPGATLGIYAALASIIRENDEVIVFEPVYDSYVPAIEIHGGKAVFAELLPPYFKPDWDQVQKLLSSKTRAIIINNPHNPSGSTLSAQDMQKLEKLIKDRNITLLSDEVYEHMVYEGKEHQSIARYPYLASRSFVVFSFGKTYHATGWKMGYVAAPKELTDEFRKIYQYMAFSCHTPSQYAFSALLDHPEYYLELAAFYEQKRNLFINGLRGSRFRFTPCEGTYFQCIDYSKISRAKALDFAKELTIKHQIASIPVSAFYRKGDPIHILRFCFAKNDTLINQATEILCQISK